MIEIAILRDHLSLGRRSLTEIATALSVSAMVGATLYNLGFFTPVEWSLISVLTVQDLLVGSTIALLPMAVATGVALIFAHLIVNAPRRKLQTAFIVGLLVIVGFAGAWHCLVGPYRSTIGHLGFSYLLLAGLAAALNLYFASRKVALVWLAFSLVYVPFSVGVSDSLGTITSGIAAQTEIETDKAVITGRILRITSGYAILFDGSAIDVIPLSKIRSMRRLYARSPELDYLGSMSSSVSGS